MNETEVCAEWKTKWSKKYSVMIHKMVLKEPLLIAQREKTAEVDTEARINGKIYRISGHILIFGNHKTSPWLCLTRCRHLFSDLVNNGTQTLPQSSHTPSERLPE